jgi:hypothetical protein
VAAFNWLESGRSHEDSATKGISCSTQITRRDFETL